MFKAAVEYTVGQLSARSPGGKNDSTDQAIIMHDSTENVSPRTANKSGISDVKGIK
jgi:hypothetical protein